MPEADALPAHHPTADAPPDPQIHTHGVILNVTQRDDGEFRSLESHDLYKLHKKAGAIYHQQLAAEARRLGYAVSVAEDGTFDLDTVPKIVVETFSHRTADIEAQMETQGRSLATASATEKAVATLATRAPTIGIARAEAKVTLANLVYNIDRLIFHERRAATG